MKRLIKKLTVIATVITAITVLLTACNFEFETPGEVFIPVESITGVPTGGIARYELVLARTVLPDNATNKTITWSVTDDGGTDTVLNRNILTARNPGTIRVSALIKNGKSSNADYIEDFEIIIYHEDNYVRVTSVSNVPEECNMGESVDMSSAFVKPLNAVNTTIIWEVKDAGETGAQINGNTLTYTALGTFVITAKVADGKSPGVDYIHDFPVTVIPPSVTSITGISADCHVGNTTLSATINPYGAFDDIIWTVKNAGMTGAQINGDTLTVTAVGTVIISARIADGVKMGVDYTQNFTIDVLP
jgi:formylmethanofuran dehydrogenase subunit D